MAFELIASDYAAGARQPDGSIDTGKHIFTPLMPGGPEQSAGKFRSMIAQAPASSTDRAIAASYLIDTELAFHL